MFFSSYVHLFTKELDDGFCYLPFIAKRSLKSILWLLTLYPRWGICSMLDEKKMGVANYVLQISLAKRASGEEGITFETPKAIL